MVWVILIAACIGMHRVAEMGDQNGSVWAGVTFVCMVLSALFIPLPFLNLLIGLIIAFGVLALISVLRK